MFKIIVEMKIYDYSVLNMADKPNNIHIWRHKKTSLFYRREDPKYRVKLKGLLTKKKVLLNTFAITFTNMI